MAKRLRGGAGGGAGKKRKTADSHPCAFLGDVFVTAAGDEVGLETVTACKLVVVLYTAMW